MTNIQRKKFFNFISPIIILFQFFGISPLIIGSKYKCITHLVFQYFRIVVVTIISFFHHEKIWLPEDLTNRIVVKVLLISYGLSVLEAIVCKKRQIKIVNQLHQIDQIIKEKFCGDFDNYDGMKKRYTAFIWMVFLGVFGLKILSATLIRFRTPVLLAAILTYTHLGINVRILQMAFYVDMVYERICIIHKELNKLKANCSSKVQKQLDLTSEIYGRLWMMINDINFTFGWSLLAIIVETIVDLINNANAIFSYCGSHDNCLNTFIGVLAFIPTLGPLIILAKSCERCEMTAKKTSAIVHSLSHFKPLQNYATDIRLLSLQLSHETFYISANGFCNIGYGTIGSIIQTSTLYLIIIIQFEINP